MADSSSEVSRWKLASFLLAGVLIPIVAALLPWVIDNWTPKNSLEYAVQGPLTADKAAAVTVKVWNSGSESQSNVQVWLPLHAQSDYATEPNKDGMPLVVEKKPQTLLASTPVQGKKEERGDDTVLYYNILRPGESIKITAFIIGGTYVGAYELDSLRIVSDKTIAQRQDNSDEFDFLFKVGTALLVGFIVFFLIYGIYYEKFMPVEKKRAELQKQLDKLPKDE